MDFCAWRETSWVSLMRPLHAACKDELCITLEGIWIDAGARYVYVYVKNVVHIYYVKQNIMSIYSKYINVYIFKIY